MPAASAILWVDDNPANNSYFIDLLQRRGYCVDLARTTAEGLALLERNSYRAVISDMGRYEDGHFDDEAGMRLLEQVKKRKPQLPFILFCSSSGVRRFRDRARTLGARAITASATELREVFDDIAPDSGGQNVASDGCTVAQ